MSIMTEQILWNSILDEFPEKLRTAFDSLPFQICFRKFIQYAKKEASCSLVWPFVGAHQHLTLPWSSPLSLSFKRKHCLFKSVKIAFYRLVAEQGRVGFVHFGALLFVHTYISWCGTGFFWRDTNWWGWFWEGMWFSKKGEWLKQCENACLPVHMVAHHWWGFHDAKFHESGYRGFGENSVTNWLMDCSYQ